LTTTETSNKIDEEIENKLDSQSSNLEMEIRDRVSCTSISQMNITTKNEKAIISRL